MGAAVGNDGDRVVHDSLGYSVHWMGDATEMEQVIGIKIHEDLNQDLVWDTLKRHDVEVEDGGKEEDEGC